MFSLKSFKFFVFFLFISFYPHYSQSKPLPLHGISRDFKNNLITNKNWEESVSLFGARGETRALVIKFDHQNKILKSNKTASYSIDLIWNEKSGSEGLSFDLYQIGYVEIKTPSYIGSQKGLYPDPLIPLDKNNFRSIIEKETSEKESFFWIDIKIPKSTPPGRYNGNLRLKLSATSEIIATMPVQLEVGPMEIPDQLSLPGYTELNPWYIEKTHQKLDHRELADLIASYFTVLKDHNFYLFKSWRRKPKLEKNSIIFDDFFLLSEGTPNSVMIDFPSDFYENVAPDDTEESKYWKATEEWIAEHKERNYFSYYLDEPTEDEISEAPEKLKVIKQLAPSLKILITTPPNPILDPYVSIYSPVMNHIDLSHPPKTLKELWWYISCMSHGCKSHENDQTPDFVIDRLDSDILSIGLLSFRADYIKTFLYFHSNYNYQFRNKDPWKEFYYFGGNGDGSLFYPGKKKEMGWKHDGPIVSIRLKLWREAGILHQYLTWLKSKDPAFLNLLDLNNKFSSVRSWVRNGNYYYELHDQAGERLKQTWKKNP